jgi:hypothetical protein
MSNRRTRTWQITGHLSQEERDRFEAYSRTCGLDAAGLLALLWARELRVARIPGLMSNAARSESMLDAKVTIHTRDERFREKVIAAAKQAHISVSNACALLVRAELDEKWLERVFHA